MDPLFGSSAEHLPTARTGSRRPPLLGSDRSLGLPRTPGPIAPPSALHLLSKDRRASTPSDEPKYLAFGPRMPIRKSRSDPVVSHHLAGFLRATTRRLVASCSRPWGSPRFGPVPPSFGVPVGGTRECSIPVLPEWSAAVTCLRGLRSEDLHPRRSVAARSSPWRHYPSKVFPRSQPSLVAWSLLSRCVPSRTPWSASTMLQPVPSRRSVEDFPLTTGSTLA